MNNLTPAQLERLAKLTEELGEVQQAIGKILLHGYHATTSEGVFYNNLHDLEVELGDVSAAVELLRLSGDVSFERISSHALNKSKVITRYMSHQVENLVPHPLVSFPAKATKPK